MAMLDSEGHDKLPSREFAFPKQRKVPIDDAGHVRAAVAHFNQISRVTGAERNEAWRRRIEAARSKQHPGRRATVP